MSISIEPHSAASTKPPSGDGAQEPLQFGLGSLLAAVSAAAVACSLLITLPPMAATPALIAISVALPAVLTIVVVYGRGYRRAFSIGALFPAGTMLLGTLVLLVIYSVSAFQNNIFQNTSELAKFAEKVGPYYRPYVGVTWVACLVVGVLSVIVQRMVQRSNRRHS